jgi:hypothetical protein
MMACAQARFFRRLQSLGEPTFFRWWCSEKKYSITEIAVLKDYETECRTAIQNFI